MKVTLSDIAEKTGFSVSTVSRTLRGEGKTSKNNERRILKAARELNYPLQKNAGTHFKQEDLFIALITGFHVGEFYASFFNGFLEAGKAKNIDVSMFSVAPNADKVCSLLARLQKANYSSAVLFVPALHAAHYKEILKRTPPDFPLLSCTNITAPVLDTVTFDAYRGCGLVAEHFIEKGYKTVGLIEGPVDQPEARFRKSGFLDIITHTPDLEFVWSYPGDYSLESGIQAYKDFKKLENKPRAVFAANDASALGFMESARSDGYNFPSDIALAGYDNLPMCEYHFPNITSVDTCYTRLATVTLDLLMERLNRPVPHQGLVSLVPVDLERRHSS